MDGRPTQERERRVGLFSNDQTKRAMPYRNAKKRKEYRAYANRKVYMKEYNRRNRAVLQAKRGKKCMARRKKSLKKTKSLFAKNKKKRTRDIQLQGQNLKKERDKVIELASHWKASGTGREAIVLNDHTHADLLLRKNPSQDWIQVQVKTRTRTKTSKNGSEGSFYFQSNSKVDNYAGMAVVFLRLGEDGGWVADGTALKDRGKNTLYLSSGGRNECFTFSGLQKTMASVVAKIDEHFDKFVMTTEEEARENLRSHAARAEMKGIKAYKSFKVNEEYSFPLEQVSVLSFTIFCLALLLNFHF